MADDDVAAERARLESLAWGGAASEAEAARARVALEHLAHRRHPGSRTARSGGATPVTPRVPSPARSAPTPAGTSSAPVPVIPVLPEDDPAARHHGEPHHEAEVTGDGGDAPRLQAAPAGWRTRVGRALWTTRPRVWIGLGVAAAVGVAFAAGTVVGTSRPEQAAAPSVSPSAGTVTLEDLLDAPQTYADQLPGPVEAPVSLRTTRLIFTNRALDGGSLDTPWSVWAGVGTDRATICLVATANRIESTSACYPRTDALHGSVSLSAQSMSGTLTLNLRGGGVQGTVTNEN
ncbi:hypothetical protein FHW23_001546 [Curtobacterium pusillum]|uniref:Anti-sigma factor n=1 Tax=Curtobacterium pusillum TaxID=69373 RepID=A0AAW3T6H0_9MICO|nr:hypothetical protein [Curtobacterium pusillum]MBA8990300.1 hypothetical protein [Curtobacterium pusillum]